MKNLMQCLFYLCSISQRFLTATVVKILNHYIANRIWESNHGCVLTTVLLLVPRNVTEANVSNHDLFPGKFGECEIRY